LILKTILVAALILSLGLVQAPAVEAVSHYVPQAGDHFSYYEVVDLGNGTGNYEGYTEHTAVNGVVEIAGVDFNGTVSAYYSYSWNWSSSDGETDSGGSSGNFTFSSASFLYVNGTDDQTGYVNPAVWFYIDNSTSESGAFLLLNTEMTVIDGNHSYYLPSQDRYVRAIYAQGTSTYQRNDEYGQFSATGTWAAYFDPSTGYIVGYRYVESDAGSGQGFTYTENLYVTSTSYPLMEASAPGENSSSLTPYLVLIAVTGVVIAFVIVLVVALWSRRRKSLPKHPSQQVSWKDWEDQARRRQDSSYGSKSPPPPDINLTAKQPPVQQIVIKEVAKVYCRYCGTLMDTTAQVCPRCGAPQG
jgi:hypothetical protein